MEFTKTLVKELAQIAEDAVADKLKELGSFHGVEIEVHKAGGSYGESEYTAKFKFTISGGETQAEKDYKIFSKLYEGTSEDLPLEMLGATFSFGPKTITVKGFLSNRSKNPISFQDATTGKNFVAPLESVVLAYRKHMARQAVSEKV
jgi:sulfite reductase beta subunit-like hemoprotein